MSYVQYSMRFLKTILDSFLYSKLFLISLSKTEVPPSSIFSSNIFQIVEICPKVWKLIPNKWMIRLAKSIWMKLKETNRTIFLVGLICPFKKRSSQKILRRFNLLLNQMDSIQISKRCLNTKGSYYVIVTYLLHNNLVFYMSWLIPS